MTPNASEISIGMSVNKTIDVIKGHPNSNPVAKDTSRQESNTACNDGKPNEHQSKVIDDRNTQTTNNTAKQGFSFEESSELIGLINGKNGTNLDKMQANHHVKVHIETQKTKENTQVVTITGHRKNIEEAYNEIYKRTSCTFFPRRKCWSRDKCKFKHESQIDLSKVQHSDHQVTSKLSDSKRSKESSFKTDIQGLTPQITPDTHAANEQNQQNYKEYQRYPKNLKQTTNVWTRPLSSQTSQETQMTQKAPQTQKEELNLKELIRKIIKEELQKL